MTPDNQPELSRVIQRALAEDIGDGDVTTDYTIPAGARLAGHFLAKEAGVIAGLEVAAITFGLLDQRVDFYAQIAEGTRVGKDTVIATVSGPGRALLSAERVSLNFLQRMSGIATLTRQYVEAVQSTHAIILDTRKTAPGLRLTDKWAVRLGGGQNHRMGLYDMALIKDNHIMAVGSLTEAVTRIRVAQLPIEVEVKNLVELNEALELKVDRILLDNMSLDDMRAAVHITNGRVPLEASGGVALDTVGAIANTGVNYISVGALTHSVKALDISLELGPLA